MRLLATLLRCLPGSPEILLFCLFAAIADRVAAQQQPAAAQKIAPVLRRARPQGPLQTVRVSVPQPAAFRAWLRQVLPAARVQAVPGSALLLVENLTPAQVQQLGASSWVTFVDVPNRRAREERQLNQSDLSLNKITTTHTQFPKLAGQGLTISIKEDSFDPADIDFKGRVVSSDLFKTTFSPHATAVATLVGGGGNSAPTGLGVAWQARLATSSFDNLLPDNGAVLAQSGISVQNHSYGVAAIENYYGLESQAYDQQARQYPSLMHVFSSGNVGTQTSTEGRYAGIARVANLTGQFKNAKNTLCVGATDALGQVASLSSRGPAADGRIKPELVAYGAGGTSESAALVSGTGALVQQAYQRGHGGVLPPAALVKAALLNSADDTGRPGPDFETGFGQLDAAGAVRTVQQQQFWQSAVAQNAQRTYTLMVPAGQQEVKVTLAWADPEAAPTAAQALVHDLDLELVHVATGRSWRPWILSSFPHADSLAKLPRRGADHLNNVEQITLTAPEAGEYTMRVRGNVVTSPQDFVVAYEYSAGFEWITPGGNTNLRPGATNLLRWQWAGPAGIARLEYQPLGSATWELLKADVPLTQSYFSWAIPDTTMLAQVRMVAGNAVFLSDTFTVAQPQTPTVGYVCEEEALLLWEKIPGVSQYQVYRLVQNYLEPYLITPDTALVLNAAQMQVRYYAVAPIVGKIMAERGTTIEFTQQGTACYIKSFLPRTVVADTVLLDLEIGTLYGLQSATLERRTADGFQAVQSYSPVTAQQMTFWDDNPAPGNNEYRIRLTLANGRTVYSAIETVQYTRPDQVQAYPNPVVAGELLSVLVNDSPDARLELYDMTGRLRRVSTVSGAVKTFDTTGLAKGMYLLRVTPAAGAVLTIRIVVL